ncbi:MAG: sulfite exporter TauE/SafE family protein [Deltaproteobacteria bacterium]|nr:sulfite exporter TauE/SafE family protein [Deltaproteobacteria bacterium]
MIALALIFFCVAAVFSALGQGGGAFYVPLLLAMGVPFHQAAAASQAVIVAVSVSAMLVFHRAGFLDWKLVLLIEPATNLGAVLGGYFSQYVPAEVGKIVFAGVLVAGAGFMIRPVAEHQKPPKRGFAYWTRTLGGETYSVNWVATIPLMAFAGGLAGLLGVGGGLLKVPLMVLACRIPIKVAVGTSSLMVGLTALTGLLGHAAAGHFAPALALPLAIGGFLGAQMGSRVSVRVDKRHLKRALGVVLVVIATWVVESVIRGG